jgi:hypothetical protein
MSSLERQLITITLSEEKTMFQISAQKVLALAALVFLCSVSASRASASGGVMAAGYSNYGTASQTYVNIGITDNGPLAAIRYSGSIILYKPNSYTNAGVLGITYLGSNQAEISYIGFTNNAFITFGKITVSVTSPTTYKGLLGVNALPTVFTGNVSVKAL